MLFGEKVAYIIQLASPIITLYAYPSFYCEERLLEITIDLKPYIEARKKHVAVEKNR